MEGKLLVTNIQRMCMHDGPGIRTTVFLKGCNLHCPWCANPENIHPFPEKYNKNGREGQYGKDYTADQLVREIEKDRRYWEPDGGVTFSGGEPLLWMDGLAAVMESLKKKGVRLAVETALQAEKPLLETAMEYVDLFIVDIKILEPEQCKEVLGGDVRRYRENVEMLKGKGKTMLFRIPCNREHTVRRENMEQIKGFLAQYADVPVEIFATHSLGKEKYESLGLPCREYDGLSAGELSEIADELRGCGNRVTVNII